MNFLKEFQYYTAIILSLHLLMSLNYIIYIYYHTFIHQKSEMHSFIGFTYSKLPFITYTIWLSWGLHFFLISRGQTMSELDHGVHWVSHSQRNFLF